VGGVVTWAKLDDNFHSHPKVREAWYSCPASIGLHVLGITFAADHETDGVVPGWFVAGAFRRPKDLSAAVTTLLQQGMWEQQGEDFLIHDFLDFHPSKAALKKKRAADAARKKRERGELDDLKEAA
jgi:hypothetical protein